MSWTHFKIVEFGERTIAKVNDVVALIETWYPKAELLTFEKINNSFYGEPFDRAKLCVTDGTTESNINNVLINFPPDKQVSLLSSNFTVAALNNLIYNLANIITYSASVDRIKIIDFQDIGILLFEGTHIFNNFEIMAYDLNLLTYMTGSGIGQPYQKIRFQVGNADEYLATIYEVDFNIAGESSILNIVASEQVLQNGIYNYSKTFAVINGTPNGNAQLELTVNLSASAWPAFTENTLNIDSLNLNYEENVNVTSQPITITLDEFGNGNINVDLSISQIDVPVTGTIEFVLISINGNTSLVSLSSNNIELIINIP